MSRKQALWTSGTMEEFPNNLPPNSGSRVPFLHKDEVELWEGPFPVTETEEPRDIFDPEIIYSKDRSMKLRISERYVAKKLVKFYTIYQETKYNRTPSATCVMIHDYRGYGLVMRKGSDRFWRVTSIFSLSNKETELRNKVFTPAIVLRDPIINEELWQAEEEMPEIRKI